ncbi:hypothetical protein QWY79_01285, partial [Halomonas sabkhae]|uniref:hypothetical protein n=1 Tax=Halomonas sabkhae TaxID=626223 RepID=UPI0025B31FA5
LSHDQTLQFQSLRSLLVTRKQQQRIKLGSRFKRSQKDSKAFDESLALIFGDWSPTSRQAPT